METIVTKSYQGAQTRLLLPKVKDVAGVIGDNNATRLCFKLPKTYATGWQKFVEFDCYVVRDGEEIKPTYLLDENNSILIPYEITESNVGKEVDYNLKLVSQDGEVVEKSEIGTLYFRDSSNGTFVDPDPYTDVVTFLYNNAFCNVSYSDGTSEGDEQLPKLTFTPMNSEGEAEEVSLNIPYLDENGYILNKFINKEIVVEIFHISTPDALTSLTQAQIPDMALIDQGSSTETHYMDLYMLVGADPTVATNWYLVHTDNPTFSSVRATSADFNDTTTVGLSVTGDETVAGDVSVTGQVSTAQVNTPKINGTGNSPNLEIVGDVTAKNGLTIQGTLASKSITDNGNVVSIIKNISATGSDVSVRNQTVSGKTTTGTLESGAATFTGNIDASNKTVTASTFIGNVTGNLTGNVTGDVTGDVTGNVTGDLTGNAATATKWQTTRKINLSGVTATEQNIDGTGDITIPVTAVPSSLLSGEINRNIIPSHADSSNKYGVGSTSQYGHVKVDSSMSDTSTNPVQNKVIKDFVNSSIGTATANFLGTYKALEDSSAPDKSLGYTQAQLDLMKDPYDDPSQFVPPITPIETKLAEKAWPIVDGYDQFTTVNEYVGYYVDVNNTKTLVVNNGGTIAPAGIIPGTTVAYNAPSPNDYVFVEMDYSTPLTSPDEYRRYKFDGTSWGYEYTLNNSSFTQAQWDTINSLITNTSDPKVGVDVKDINAHLGDSKIHVPAETTAGKVLTSNDNGQAGWSVLKTINSGSLIGSGDLGLVDLSTAQTIAGSKTFTYYPCIRVNANSGQGGGGAYTQLNYVDNGGTERAHLRTQIGNAQTIVEMTARKFDGTGGVGMGVYNPESGDGFALAPARSYASGSTTQTASDILTKWHLESDITIDGIKTFTRGTSSGLAIIKRVGGDASSVTTNATLSFNTNAGQRGNINNWENGTFVSTQMSAVGNSTKYIAVYSNKADNVGWADAPYRTYNASNTSDIVTIGSLQASTDVVHTAGAETVGGQKTFTNTPIISSHALILKNGSYAKDLSSTTYTNFADIVINDKNDTVLSQIRTDHLQDNSRRVFLLLERTINSTNYQNRLSLIINSSGDSYVTLPHRSYGSAGNDDVLVKSHLESKITIGGTKTFTESVLVKSTNLDVTNVSSNSWAKAEVFKDSNDKDICSISPYLRTTGKHEMRLLVWDSDQNAKNLIINSEGYVTAPFRAYANTVSTANASDVLVRAHVPDMMSANVGNGQISFTSSRGTAIDNFTVNQSSGKNIVLPAGSTQYQDEEVTFALQSTPDFSDYPYMASKSITGLTSDMYATVTFSDAQVSSGQYAPFCQTLSGEIRLYAKSNVGAQTIPTISVGMDDSSAQQSMSNFVTLNGAQTVGGTKTFTNDIYVFKTNPALRLKQNTDVYTTTPSGNLYAVLGFHDKNDAGVGGLSTAHYTNGKRKVYLDALGENGTKKSLELYVEPNGTGYMNGPYRTYSASNTSDVVTIGSLQASTDVVHQTGNESVNGVKDFKGTLMSNGIFSNKCAQNIESTSIWRRLYYTSDVVSNQVLTLLITSQKGTIFEGGILIIYGGNSSVNMSWLAKGIDTVTSNYVVVQRTDGIHEVWVRNVNGNRGLCAIKLNETNWGSPSYYWVVDATTTSSTFDPTDTSKYSVYAISS